MVEWWQQKRLDRNEKAELLQRNIRHVRIQYRSRATRSAKTTSSLFWHECGCGECGKVISSHGNSKSRYNSNKAKKEAATNNWRMNLDIYLLPIIFHFFYARLGCHLKPQPKYFLWIAVCGRVSCLMLLSPWLPTSGLGIKIDQFLLNATRHPAVIVGFTFLGKESSWFFCQCMVWKRAPFPGNS